MLTFWISMFQEGNNVISVELVQSSSYKFILDGCNIYFEIWKNLAHHFIGYMIPNVLADTSTSYFNICFILALADCEIPYSLLLVWNRWKDLIFVEENLSVISWLLSYTCTCIITSIFWLFSWSSSSKVVFLKDNQDHKSVQDCLYISNLCLYF